MSAPLLCDDVVRRDLAAGYLAGRLDLDDEERLELHLLTCARCQAEVRFAAGVGQLVRAPARPRLRIAAGAAVALAAGLAAVLLLRPGPATPYATLGELDVPPLYLSMRVRADASAADSLFDDAMRAYVRDDFAAAEAGLRAALDAGADTTATSFFLAASLLVQDRPAEAADLYGRVMAAGDTPYLPEARFYLAKALLRLGRGEEAVRELRVLAGEDHELSAWAGALVDSAEAIPKR